MFRDLAIVVGGVIVISLLWAGWTAFESWKVSSSSSVPLDNEQVFCTADAKECPDGSYVGRVGPSCEFAPCPTGITGPWEAQ